MKSKQFLATLLMSSMILSGVGSVNVMATQEEREILTADGWVMVLNENGETLGYSPESGVTLIEEEGLLFKDLNKNGALDTYEDWREDDETRAAALAEMMTAEEILPLLLHCSIPSFTEELTPESQVRLDIGQRTVQAGVAPDDPAVTVKINNNLQAYVEASNHGVPVQITTDPGYGKPGSDKILNGMPVSNLAYAATFDTELVGKVYEAISKMYRAVGVTTLLGPQIDLATEPRWPRIQSTFGEDPALSRDMANAQFSALQSTYDEDGTDLGWGDDSVIGMAKHFPGDGMGEGGRESHNEYGKYAVYPGDNFEAHLIPFFDGVFALDSITEKAAAIMPSFSIAYDEDEKYGDLVGSGYSDYKIGLLRNNGYDELLVTDWQIFIDNGKPWGVEDLTPAERCRDLIKNGIDQLGGVWDMEMMTEAYKLLEEDLGEEAALARVRESARRLFVNMNRTNLFDNPYLSEENTLAVYDSQEIKDLAQEVIQKGIVMLKNADNTIKPASEIEVADEKPTVYIPMTFSYNTYRHKGYEWILPVDLEEAEKSYNIVTDTVGEPTGKDQDGNAIYTENDIIRASKEELAECDMAIVFAKAPTASLYTNGGYDAATETYTPVSLQYREYTADSESVRQESIAGDRSYYGQTAEKQKTATDLDAILYAADNVPEDAKVIVCMGAKGPMIMSEFEEKVDAILVNFDWGMFDYNFTNSNMFDIIQGKVEPTGLLPVQMPKDMETVEAQLEDVPRDMECYTDAEGNTYDFAYGLNWSGVISDERTEKYNVEPLTTLTNSISLER